MIYRVRLAPVVEQNELTHLLAQLWYGTSIHPYLHVYITNDGQCRNQGGAGGASAPGADLRKGAEMTTKKMGAQNIRVLCAITT